MSHDLPTTPQLPMSVQPGGGFVVGLELAWGRCRRAWLRAVRPGYVRHMAEKRQGACPNCPHDIVDARDLKFTRNVCGYSFRPVDDRFAWRNRLGFARHGLAEMLFFTSLFLLGLAGASLLAVFVHPWLGLLAVPLFVLWLEIPWFFRDPERTIPPDENAVVSPADGAVTHVEEIDEPELGRMLRISIFLSVFNVHVNRHPRNGTVTNVRYFPGAYLDARRAESAVRNEQLWIDMTDAATGRPLRVKQISGAIARRIVCWLKAGDVVVKGDRLGMIKFGSRTDLLLPPDRVVNVCIKVGDKVHGGATVLARLK